VNFGQRTLYIPETKTDTPREIPLSAKALAILEGQPRKEGHRVWEITAGSVTQAYNRACKRAALEDLRFHDLRHEAISRLFEAGFSVMETILISGHRSPEMAARYTHLRASDLVKKIG
jgi:integrase